MCRWVRFGLVLVWGVGGWFGWFGGWFVGGFGLGWVGQGYGLGTVVDNRQGRDAGDSSSGCV